MALIPFPSGDWVIRSDLALLHPGQIVLRSIYGAGSEVFGRGPGHWAGRLEIAQTDRATDAQRRAVETFLSRLRGRENVFEVPIERPSAGTLTAGTALVASGTAISSGALEITVTGAASGLVAGDYVRMGDRLYQLVTDHQNSTFTVEPPALPPAGVAVVWENVTCLARLGGEGRESGLSSSWTPDFGGPWVIDWEEAY